MNKIKMFKTERVVIVKAFFDRNCWVPGANTLVSVNRNTRGNQLPGHNYKMTFSEAVKGGYLDDIRGTMSVSIFDEIGNPMHWVPTLNTFGIFLDDEV